MNYAMIGVGILALLILVAIALFFFERTRKHALKAIAGTAAALIIASGGIYTLNDGGLHDQSRLVDNTYFCQGSHCEATFTINATAANKSLQRNIDVFITFEDKEKNNKTVKFKTEFEVYHFIPHNVTRERFIAVYNTTAENGTVIPVYGLRNTTEEELVRVDTGKKLQSGVENYIRIWTDDFDEQWVDWQVLIKNIPKEVLGVNKDVDFDTHNKGWAVWSATDSTDPADYFFYDDAEGGAMSSSYTSISNAAYASDQKFGGSQSIKIASTNDVNVDNTISSTNFTSAEYSTPYCIDFEYRAQADPAGLNNEAGLIFGSGWGAGPILAVESNQVVASDLTLYDGASWNGIKAWVGAGNWGSIKMCFAAGYAASGNTVATIYDNTGLIYTTGSVVPRSSLGRINLHNRINMGGANNALWIDNIRIWNYTKYGITPPQTPVATGIYAVQNLSNMTFNHNASYSVQWNVTNSSVRCIVVNLTSNDSSHPIDNRTGWINFTGPNISATGVSYVNFTARDNCSNNITNSIWINVTNTAPTNDWGSGSVWQLGHNDGSTQIGGASGADADNDAVTCTFNDTVIQRSGSNAVRNLTKGMTDIGVHSVLQTCTDGLASTTATRSLNITNAAPACSAVANNTWYVGETIGAQLSCSDADGDAITYSDNSTSATVSATGYVNVTVQNNTNVYLLTASDSLLLGTTTWTINGTEAGYGSAVALCRPIPRLKFIADMSKANMTTGKTTQAQLANGTVSCTFNVTTAYEPGTIKVQAKTNYTNGSYTIAIGTLNLTSSFQDIGTVNVNSTLLLNATGYWNNASYNVFPITLTVRITR
jgi:hypothetical protein